MTVSVLLTVSFKNVSFPSAGDSRISFYYCFCLFDVFFMEISEVSNEDRIKNNEQL